MQQSTERHQDDEAVDAISRISGWIFACLFIGMLTGIADPFTNYVFRTFFLPETGWLNQALIEWFGPSNLADEMRSDDFWGFAAACFAISAIIWFVVGLSLFAIVTVIRLALLPSGSDHTSTDDADLEVISEKTRP